MKKLLVILSLLVFSSVANASCDTCQCVQPYDLTSGFSRFFSVVTGQNFLGEKIAQHIIKREIKKELQDGSIKVKLDSYSVRDLKAGRFKSLDITGKNVVIDGIYISKFEAKTLCKFNYIDIDKQNNVTIKEDIPLGVKVVVSEDDLNNTMNSSDYKRILGDINSITGGLNLFHIDSTKIKIKNDKIYYAIKYSVPFVRKSQEVVLCAKLKVTNGEIKLSDTEFIRKNSMIDINSFSQVLNYINPLDFSVKILENKDADLNIKDIEIDGKNIVVSGVLTALKDKE